MIDLLIFLMPPITVCAISALLFGYFGLHVLLRGVIFVDIALAQVAALGTLTGMMCGIGRDSALLVLVALLAVTAASALLAMINFESVGLPQEGLIGIVYCLALAACLFLAEFIPNGAGFVKESLTGALLWVTWSKVAVLVSIGAVVGAFHLTFRRKFGESTGNNCRPGTGKTGIWEFLFYFSLGIVIVETVGVLGVFLVFSMLVVPAAVGLMFCGRWITRLLVAWTVGIVACLAGILSADAWNLPTAPSIVVVLGTVLIAASVCGAILGRTALKSSARSTLAHNTPREEE